mgnify:FL=1
MSFPNLTNINPRKSIRDLVRDAVSRSLSEDDCLLYVARRVSTRRISKRQLREIFRELS